MTSDDLLRVIFSGFRGGRGRGRGHRGRGGARGRGAFGAFGDWDQDSTRNMMENDGFGDWNPDANKPVAGVEAKDKPVETKRERKSRWGDAEPEAAPSNGIVEQEAFVAPGASGDDMDLVDASESYPNEEQPQEAPSNGEMFHDASKNIIDDNQPMCDNNTVQDYPDSSETNCAEKFVEENVERTCEATENITDVVETDNTVTQS